MKHKKLISGLAVFGVIMISMVVAGIIENLGSQTINANIENIIYTFK